MKLILPCAHVSFAFLATYFLYTPKEFACDHSNLGSRVAITQPLVSYFCRLVSNSPKLTSASMSPNRHKGVLFLNEWAPLLRSNLKKLVKMNLVYFRVCLRYSLLSDANQLYTSRGNIRHSKNRTWVQLSSKLLPRIVNRIRERDDSKLKFRSRKALLLKMTSLKTFHKSKVGCEEFKEETSSPQGNKMRFSMATPLNPNASSQSQLKTISFWFSWIPVKTTFECICICFTFAFQDNWDESV